MPPHSTSSMCLPRSASDIAVPPSSLRTRAVLKALEAGLL